MRWMDPPYDKASREEIWQSDLRQRYAMRCARMEASAYGVIRVNLRLKLLCMASIRLSTLFSVRLPHAKRVRTDRY